MKKLNIGLLILAATTSFALAGCDEDTPNNPPAGDNDDVVIVDDCPEGKSTTGEPCK